MNTSNSYKRSIATVLLAFSMIITAWAEEESKLIKDLASPRAGTVTSALLHIEKSFPNSAASLPAIKKLLTDPRVEVRRKAARVLGAMHSDVDAENIKAIITLIKASDPDEIIDGLKALRGLKAPAAVSEILPLLHHPDSHVIRDACRTLGVLGSKETITALEPLLKNANPAVRKDAQDAIFALQSKA